MNPERLWGSHSRLRIRWRTRLKSQSSIGPASHFKEAVVTSGKEWPRTRSLHEWERRGMSSNLRPAEGSFQVQAGASPVCWEGGKEFRAFPAGKWHPAFCHVKSYREKSYKSLTVTSGTWEIFFVCAAGLAKEVPEPRKWDLHFKTALYTCQDTCLHVFIPFYENKQHVFF